ncbi:penicillin-binding transpeptidase domain-containing protein [Alkalibacillus salilacus]|uniref:serine-type D-Ala-D-Ala carboxypeptidase n=1 Tax=Alkalibacillus salilacus TaxID=284582 RepID=A0ABT9VDE3_9BACI|nr:penicillin-binding transpeptidase domain-containing protein [Alkalibacillus salilacus]MDQ0158885.1 penicillin-binding protein [Alkalibacillus salilacus]
MKKTFVLIPILIFVLVACSDEEVVIPHDSMGDYIALWEENSFQEMYDQYLTSDATESFGEENFVERYNDLYNDLEISNLSVEMTNNNEEHLTELRENIEDRDEYEMPLKISFSTLAGDVEYEVDVNMTKQAADDHEDLEEDRWLINWKPELILPGLEKNEKVSLERNEGRRGDILDRNGNALATLGEVYEVGITPEQFDESNLDELSESLTVSNEYIQNKLNQSWVEPNYFVPIRNIGINEEDVVEDATSVSGVTTRVKTDRVYPYGKAAAHLTGYIGPITASELEERESESYSSNDVIGKRGLEQLFEDQLRAEDGVAIVIEKNNGSNTTVVEKEPVDGETVETTIDMNVQETLYDIVKEEAGTATVMHPQTGEVLSLLSFPTFDPNQFVMGMSNAEYDEVTSNENNPTLNRFASNYSPGSTMKLLTSLVGFKQDELSPEEVEQIEGLRWQKDSSWGDYYVTRVSSNYSEVDFDTAMTHSDNIYFARLGLDIGADPLASGLQSLGFGEPLPFTYPLPASQVSNSGEITSEGMLADTSFGQGEVLINNTHLASIYSGVANDGEYMKPKLLLNEQDEVWLEDVVTNEENQILQDALRSVVTDGSATQIDLDGKAMAGKTGTAELKSSHEENDGKQNGLFVSYDQNNPDLLLSLLVEGVQDRGGSGAAVDLSKQFFETYE